ncbi:hypothetical protein AURDEDRAFT_112238 [Auricularia subglabra TFB-10046 SS5]|nr:hypothetical protein AURDEDRAFT_112238 [Auricularia subglabra TFB-10046 SS5]
MSSRPQRAKRATFPLPDVSDAEDVPKPKPTRGKKRKADDDDEPMDEIEDMLTNPKSRLVSAELSGVINSHAWGCLSPDARAVLCTLLPPAAFPGFEPELDPRHPARRGQASENGYNDANADGNAGQIVELDPKFLESAPFQAALSTFQDHLSNGYFSREHVKELGEYTTAVREGTLHAAWKDDAWDERLNGDSEQPQEPAARRPPPPPKKTVVPRLLDLVNDDVILVGDVLSYDRTFSAGVRIQKDVLIHSIHPRTHALSVLFSSSSTEALPAQLLASPPDLSVAHTAASVTTPAQLEAAILSADGRAGRVPRLSATEASEVAWKSFVLWRPAGGGAGEKGGRTAMGMLIALRGAWVAEQTQ